MNSPKPPLQQLVYQGSPGKSLLLTKESGASRQLTAENCDPNLEKGSVPGGAAAVFRKNDTSAAAVTAASTLEVKHRVLPEIDHVKASEAREEATARVEEGEQYTSEDKNTPHKCGAGVGFGQQLQQFKSPTKPATATSPGGGQGHSYRQHFCRSPRCASNNPDYATPAQVPPRKYLISKRHLLPGAICTRDPSTLPTTQIPLPPSSTGKPPPRPQPSSASKQPTTNTFRQLSFKDASSEASKSGPAGKAATSSPLDTDCIGTVIEAAAACGIVARSHAGNLELLQDNEQNGVVIASQAHLQEQEQQDGIEQEKHVNYDCKTADVGSCDDGQDVEQLRSNVVSGSEKQLQEHQLQDGIDQAEATNYDCNTADLGSCDEGQEVEELRSYDDEGDCTPELNSVGSETFSDVEGDNTTSITFTGDPVPGSVSSVGAERCESPDFAALAGESSDSSVRAVSSPVSGNTSEEEAVPDASCGLTDRQVCDEFLPYRAQLIESADDPPLDVDDVIETLGQRLTLEKMDATTSPSCPPFCDDGVVDIYDLAAAASTSESGKGAADIEEDYILRCRTTEDGREAENSDCMDAEACVSHTSSGDDESEASEDCPAENSVDVGKGVENEGVPLESETSFGNCNQEPELQRAPPRFGRSKGRQLWRSDCRDSREVVTLKPTNYSSRDGGEWMVDSLLEGAINRLKPSGEGRVRLLVEAFESLMNITEPEPEKRPSRVWCFNRMGKGEVDDDGDECEEGDQRVDCYEVSGDRLELRASMRLSLGGSSRHDICSVDEEEMNAVQKVQDWDDRQASNPPECSDNKDTNGGDQNQNSGWLSTGHGETTTKSCLKAQAKMTDKDRTRVQMYNEVKKQLGYKTEDNVKMKIQRYNRPKGSFKSSSVKSETESNLGSSEKSARALRNTNLEPFRLLTEERGALKEYQFAKRLEQLFAQEERLRNPVAQGLPWTTDEPEVVPKPPVKQPTKHVDFTHYSDSRAAIRAEFDHYIAEREMYMKMQRDEEDRRRQIAEQEEIRRIRREMVPRAQLMPFFDQPFMPTRSTKRLTVPKEPNFKTREHKRAKCMVFQQGAT